jgi:hypothetical protein
MPAKGVKPAGNSPSTRAPDLSHHQAAPILGSLGYRTRAYWDYLASMPPPITESAGPAAGRLRRRLPQAALLAASLGVVVMLVLFDPAQHAFYPRCQFHEWTGLHCPGCGSLRALHALGRGDVIAAFGLNPLLLVLLPYLGGLTAMTVWPRVAGQAWARGLCSVKAGWTVVVLCVLFAILRNVPFTPFQAWAP